MKKIIFVLAVVSLFILVACAQKQPQQSKAPVQAETPAQGAKDVKSVEERVVKTQPEAPAQEPETTEIKPSVKEIKVTAKQFEFIPNPIEVNKGDRVRLKITSIDVVHGFALPDFGISKTLELGKEVIVEFTADKSGEFAFFCNVPCGSGHRNMRGKLIVK